MLGLSAMKRINAVASVAPYVNNNDICRGISRDYTLYELTCCPNDYLYYTANTETKEVVNAYEEWDAALADFIDLYS